MDKSANTPAALLKNLIGFDCTTEPAEPLATALRQVFPHIDSDGTTAAAIIGMLYLSHIKRQLPIHILRAYCTAVREETATFSFDCRLYEKITAAMPFHDDICPVQMLDAHCTPCQENVTREDIDDALDFYTNR